MNLGIRGVLADMTEMPDYDALAAQVYDSALVPFTFGGGVYAMPVTQTFNMMFVRDDILHDQRLFRSRRDQKNALRHPRRAGRRPDRLLHGRAERAGVLLIGR